MLRLRFVTILIVLASLFLTVQPAHADETDYHFFKFQAFDFSMNVPPDQRWTAELLGTGMVDVSNRHLGLYGITGGVGFYFFQNMALILDVSGYGFNEGHSNGAAVGVTLGIRHQIFSVEKTECFLDVSGGAIEASNNTPMGGTHLNNTIEFGVGFDRPIANHLYLTAGVRYFHISNARSAGPDRNPSANGVQGIVGLIWKF